MKDKSRIQNRKEAFMAAVRRPGMKGLAGAMKSGQGGIGGAMAMAGKKKGYKSGGMVKGGSGCKTY